LTRQSSRRRSKGHTHAWPAAARLRTIVLDDFGTGYSSLSYLRLFPFDQIKIDRSFVSELSSNADCAAIVSAVASLGRSLHVDTVAEGVETEDQLLLARAAGCTHVQGFLFGRPCAVSQVDFTRLATQKQREAV
jgi:EAL domain-containing protein (putative c-di-GMP-specific phosphodiesterase class I)